MTWTWMLTWDHAVAASLLGLVLAGGIYLIWGTWDGD